jgi:hypothetical protein
MQRSWSIAALTLGSLALSLGLIVSDAEAVVWEIQEGVLVEQAVAAVTCEVLPGENMDAHTITWYPGPHGDGGIRFFPSWNWGTPLVGDWLCWLYDSPTVIIWWEGIFWSPCPTITIQLTGCNSNDGWVDIYVDGVLEFSHNCYHATNTSVRLIGSGLPNVIHTVRIQTRPGGGDVPLDYVAGGAGPSSMEGTTWGRIKNMYR